MRALVPREILILRSENIHPFYQKFVWCFIAIYTVSLDCLSLRVLSSYLYTYIRPEIIDWGIILSSFTRPCSPCYLKTLP